MSSATVAPDSYALDRAVAGQTDNEWAKTTQQCGSTAKSRKSDS